MQPSIIATGTVAAINRVDLVARVSGTLLEAPTADGLPVRKGDVLFRIDQTTYQNDLNGAEAGLRQAQASLDLAELNFTRQTDLRRTGVTSESTIENAQMDRDSAMAARDKARTDIVAANINLGYTVIRAPFDGSVTARTIDPGAFVNASTAPVLASVVQIDPMHVSFTISEQQALLFQRNFAEHMAVGRSIA